MSKRMSGKIVEYNIINGVSTRCEAGYVTCAVHHTVYGRKIWRDDAGNDYIMYRRNNTVYFERWSM